MTIYCCRQVYRHPRNPSRLVLRLKTRDLEKFQTHHARAVAAIKIGRALRDEEVVHHINGDPGDDSFANLEVLPSRGAHSLIHLRMRECSGCGCSVDERTLGCSQCRARHGFRRRERTLSPFVPSHRELRRAA